jgi:hypothetical protein
MPDLRDIKADIKRTHRDLSDGAQYPRFAAAQSIEFNLIAAKEAQTALDELVEHLSILYGRRCAETEDGTWPAKAHPEEASRG